MKKIIANTILILLLGYVMIFKLFNYESKKDKIEKGMVNLNDRLEEIETICIKDSLNETSNSEIQVKDNLVIRKIEHNLLRFLNNIQSYDDLEIIKPYLELKPGVLKSIPSMTPLEKQTYRTSSTYGVRKHPISKKIKNHNGFDLAANQGSKVYATADGRVSLAKISNQGYGNHILIEHRFGFETKYGHLQQILISNGEFVNQGQLIGYVGTTGLSTGPHLHYEIIKNNKLIDPYPSFNLSYNYLSRYVNSTKQVKLDD